MIQELSYDAWGRLRNPSNQIVYSLDDEPVLLLGRGYTGHEHLSQFGLVNMNARLYDPVLGRFLSPDPFVQYPEFSQNFNRYAYAMNNPLRYVDEDGEFIHIIIGAIIGGTANVIYKAVSGQLHSFKDGFVAFGIGAAAGGIGAATGGLAFAAAGGAAGGLGGFIAGAAAGAASSAAMMPIQSAGNSLYFGDPFISAKDYAMGVLGGAVVGGVGNGAVAAFKGRNFWTGKDIQLGRNIFSFKNIAVESSTQNPSTNHLPDKTPNSLVPDKGTPSPQEAPAPVNQYEVEKRPFVVTEQGVVLPQDPKYEIPSHYIENPNVKLPNSTSYGVEVNGKFVEKLRIDAGTVQGMKGPNTSHYHLNMKSNHLAPETKRDPGFIPKKKN